MQRQAMRSRANDRRLRRSRIVSGAGRRGGRRRRQPAAAIAARVHRPAAGARTAPTGDRGGQKPRQHTGSHPAVRSAGILGIELGAEAAEEIARRSRGTPRIANRLLRRVRDFAEVRADGVITRDVAKSALAVYDVDELGLDRLDRAVLSALTRSFGGGPVGVSTLAVAVGEEATTVEEVCEPFLVRAGMIARTPRGLVATAQAWTHIGLRPPMGSPGDFGR